MKFIKLLTLSLFIGTTIASNAQEKELTPKTFKYGKVDLAEFNTKVSGTDSAASAVVLFDVGRGYFQLDPTSGSFNYILERHVRYKIYNKAGYDYANLELQFYNSNGSKTDLRGLEGATYNLEGGKIITSKLNKEAKFSEKQDKNYTLKKFALPNIKEGSIVEFKYKITSDFIFTLNPWYFQREIPTLYSKYDVLIPSYYLYKESAGGFLYINPKRTVENQNYMGSDGSFNLETTHYSYQAENVPGLKKESYITTIDDYLSKVDFELSSITIPGQVYRQFTSTWGKIAKELKTDENFGSFIKRNGSSKTIVKNLIQNATDPDTIIKKIFEHVKTSIKWNGSYNLYTSELTSKSIFDKKAGNSGDINLSLLVLLKEAGINALPVLVSTRDNGAHPGYPMLTKFNSIIVEAKIGERSILLDATNKSYSPNLISYQHMNHQGLKLDIDLELAEWISLETKNVSRKTINYMLTLDTDNKLSGKLYLTGTDFEGLTTRNKYISATDQNDFLKSFKSDKPGLQVSNYTIENVNNPYELLNETMDVVIEDNLEEAGNLVYFTPLLFDRTKENPFKSEERNFPVDFAYPSEEMYRISIDYPKGYQLDKIPKSEKYSLPEGAASFTFLVAQQDNKIALTSKITVNKSLFTPEEYHYLKELFKSVVRKQAEQLVFKKI
ncbi:DUF3857 domain-containing protein [Pedobacter metabolipauper]|uniref:Uncharacterized protein DUF3858 n=1 Tax=Pedobacter metabolipauper TaxID=425513 RepID=A0A4R6SQK0_9SPHI|nr:DUF3857 domain-containing protein [Pedobacter metabolipauper]TDQ06419.1 uncharacterized protein DUF3858 [Pedobacter metabolipauper]